MKSRNRAARQRRRHGCGRGQWANQNLDSVLVMAGALSRGAGCARH